MIKNLFFILSLAVPLRISCQEKVIPEVIKDIAEELADSESDPEAAAVYADKLYELSEDPVNLNSASADEISRLFFLTDFQVKALSDYTHTSGRIYSYNELAIIPGFDRATTELMIPFCTLAGKDIAAADSSRWSNLLITNLSVRPGQPDAPSLGSAWKILTKYKFTAGKFSGGVIMEKDPGEKFFSPGTNYPDYLSANLSYSGKGIIRKVIAGDYSIRFGQGTNINTGLSRNLSLTSQGFMSAVNEIKPYTSADENISFKGVAAALAINKTEITLFYSGRKTDATPGSSPGDSTGYIENLYKSGIHNTLTALQKKDAVSETVYGINLKYNLRNASLGIAWSENRFSLPLIPSVSEPDKLFSFSGQSNDVWSVYYNILIKKILFYGELSANDLNKYTIIQGVTVRPGDRLTVNFLCRGYTPGYVSFHGEGQAGGSSGSNGNGILGNFSFEAAKHLFISGGFDIRHYPWLKYRCSSPSWGVRREVRIKYISSDKLVFDALYSYRFSMADSQAVNRIPELRQTTARSLKLAVRYSAGENLTLGTRLDYKIVDPQGSKGMLLLQDINYRLRSLPVSFWIRFCIFSTDDYDARLYTWENDLLYSYSIPALSGTGSRFYIMAAWKITRNAEFRFRYSVTSKKSDPAVITDTQDFRMQLKIFI
jgi:hypothetical protein